jgi:hypothetical protein
MKRLSPGHKGKERHRKVANGRKNRFHQTAKLVTSTDWLLPRICQSIGNMTASANAAEYY